MSGLFRLLPAAAMAALLTLWGAGEAPGWRTVPLAESRAVGEEPRSVASLDEIAREAALSAVEEVGEGKVAPEEIWFTILDARDPRDPRIGHYQGDALVYPASVVKMCYMVAAYDQVATGQLRMTPDLLSDIRVMMDVSSNTATSRIFDLLCNTGFGPELEGEALESFEWKKYTVHRYMQALGLEELFAVNKTYAAGVPLYGREFVFLGERVADNYEYSNKMSTNATSRLLYMIWRRALVSPEASEEMLEHMLRGNGRGGSRFLGLLPESATLYSKPGGTPTCRHDAGIIELADGGAIIVSAFSFVRTDDTYPPVIQAATEKALEVLLDQPGELDLATADPDRTLHPEDDEEDPEEDDEEDEDDVE